MRLASLANVLVAFVATSSAVLAGCGSSADAESPSAAVTDGLSTVREVVGAYDRAPGAAGPRTLVIKGEGEAPHVTGRYFADTGIVCFRAPCPSTEEGTWKLIDRGTEQLVELTGVRGDDSAAQSVLRVTETAHGVELVGEGDDSAVHMIAQTPCVVTGCGGTVCAASHVITTCEWRPEHACYQREGFCGRTGAGKCGWMPTAGLNACLANPGK